jgi:hypothetical protein
MSFRASAIGETTTVRVRRGTDLFAVSVTHNGIELGRAVDVLVDLDAGRTVGLEVRCGDDAVRFLPLGAARLGVRDAEVASPLALVDDLAFYRARGVALRELRGARVTRAGAPVGTLADVLVGDDGTIDGLVVETVDGEKRTPLSAAVSIRRERDASAA